MKVKSLLLGTAAVMAVTGAQAADLSIAEPVDYVRVCDAFGTGYWYIPGTDTCIKLGGRARFEVLFHTNSVVQGNEHSASWQFVSSMMLNFNAKSMTEHGVLNGYIELEGVSDNDADDNLRVQIDHAYLELGPFLAGRTGSTYDYGGGFGYGESLHSDTKTDQMRLTWAMHGFGLMLALEDPRDRWGTEIGDFDMPDIVGAMTFSQGSVSGKLSVGYANGSVASAWGVQGAVDIALDSIAPGDALRLKAAWGDTSGTGIAVNSFTGSTVVAGDSSWMALASFKHYWTSTLYSTITYAFNDNGSANNVWAVGGDLVWAPYTGFSAGFGIKYQNQTAATTVSSTQARIRISRDW